jgi:ankyrin repeat protein
MGRTPLHYAAATGNVELVSLLLQWHANPSVVDKVSDGLVLTVEYISQLKGPYSCSYKAGNVALDVNSALYKQATERLIPGGTDITYHVA